MTRGIGLGLVLLVMASITSAPVSAQGSVEIEIDCDHGGNLRNALRRAERAGFARIKVRGTCIGSNTVQSNNWIEIIGDPAGGAVLKSGAGVALTALNPGRVELSNLRIVGSTGVLAVGSRRVIGLVNCEVEADFRGVVADSGAGVLLQDSDVAALNTAVYVQKSDMVVERTRLHDSSIAARMFGGQLWLNDVEVVNNGVGVSAHDRASVAVFRGVFRENGQQHLGAATDSRLSVYNAQIGGPGDTTHLSLSVNGGAAVEVFYDDPEVDVWGGANVHGDSFIGLEGATLHGSIQLREFSRLFLDGTVEAGVGCGSAADAWCGPRATATSSGCASAPQVCLPVPRGAAPGSMLRKEPRGRSKILDLAPPTLGRHVPRVPTR